MDVFVYGGCYTNDTSAFEFAGLDLPAMLVNYQQEKEDNYQAELEAASINASMTINSPVQSFLSPQLSGVAVVNEQVEYGYVIYGP